MDHFLTVGHLKCTVKAVYINLLEAKSRAGGNGTAGTAMAVPVLREKKWRRLDSNLRVRYRMASPSG